MELAQTLGCSIYEAQYRISTEEFEIWLAYRDRYGSLSVSTTLKWMGALTCYMIAESSGKEFKEISIMNFLPDNWNGDQDEAEDLDKPMTQEEARAMMMQMRMMVEKAGGSRKGKTRIRVRKKPSED